MNKNFFYNRHHIDKNDIKHVVNSLKSNLITKGNYLKKFEKKLSKLFGSKFSIATSNATSAFDIISSSLEFKRNEIAILSANTFCSCANSLSKFKIKFEFCDIKNDEPNMDPNQLEKEIILNKKLGKKVKLVVITDYAGIPADWEKFKKLKSKYNFILINDNCHALGSTYKNRADYACKYADLVVQSFHAVKNITTAEGGAILTNSSMHYKLLIKLREHGFTKKNYWTYDLISPGFNSRLSEMQCALGYSQLDKLNKFLKKRKKIANFYINYFKNNKFISTPSFSDEKNPSYHLFFLRINFKEIKLKRDVMIKKLQKSNIFLQVHYIPTYKFQRYKKLFNKNKLKNTEDFYNQTVSIPIYFDLKIKDQKFICDKISNFL